MLDRFKSIYAELPRVYWTIWLGTLVNKLGSVVVPFLALYLTQERLLSKALAGLLISLYGVGAILAGLTGGMLADRYGRRVTLLLSLFGGALATLGIGFARQLSILALFTFLVGWLGEMYRPAVAALIADVVPPEKRTRAYGLLYWVINLGFAVAMMVGGLAATKSNPDIEDTGEPQDRFGWALAAHDWNGDGRDDLAIGSSLASRPSGLRSSPTPPWSRWAP